MSGAGQQFRRKSFIDNYVKTNADVIRVGFTHDFLIRVSYVMPIHVYQVLKILVELVVMKMSNAMMCGS